MHAIVCMERTVWWTTITVIYCLYCGLYDALSLLINTHVRCIFEDVGNVTLEWMGSGKRMSVCCWPSAVGQCGRVSLAGSARSELTCMCLSALKLSKFCVIWFIFMFHMLQYTKTIVPRWAILVNENTLLEELNTDSVLTVSVHRCVWLRRYRRVCGKQWRL